MARIEIDINEFNFYKNEIKRLSDNLANKSKIVEKLIYDNEELSNVVNELLETNIFNRIFRWHLMRKYFNKIMNRYSINK